MNSLKTRAGLAGGAIVASMAFLGCANAPATPSAAPTPRSGASATAADAPTPSPTPQPTPVQAADPHEVILAVETRGGRCVGGPCGDALLVDRDGTVHVAAKPPNQLGVVPAEKMAALEDAIRTTDFAEVFSHPFTGDCPTAYDGQELVFEFATPDAIQQVAGCTVDIDYGSPLFKAVTDAVGEFVPLLNQ
jgi:hypothetical protein